MQTEAVKPMTRAPKKSSRTPSHLPRTSSTAHQQQHAPAAAASKRTRHLLRCAQER
jgi:hypothetical protein